MFSCIGLVEDAQYWGTWEFSIMQDVAIFGYSRSELSDEEFRDLISESATCRVDEQYVFFVSFYHDIPSQWL